jgi:D-aminopeptidase
VTLGVLLQANFGGTLRLAGVPVEPLSAGPPDDGSCMIVVATDARVDARQSTRLARRAVFGLARVGASYGNGSGDYAIAFSTARDDGTARRPMADHHLDALFAAALAAVEESVLNALCAATTVTGRLGRTAHAVPHPRLRALAPGPGKPG